MRAHKIWTATCKGCNPWARVVEHPLTREPIVQALHEDHCSVFPRLHRLDTKRAQA